MTNEKCDSGGGEWMLRAIGLWCVVFEGKTLLSGRMSSVRVLSPPWLEFIRLLPQLLLIQQPGQTHM